MGVEVSGPVGLFCLKRDVSTVEPVVTGPFASAATKSEIGTVTMVVAPAAASAWTVERTAAPGAVEELR